MTFSASDAELLNKHLQALADVELFTIPVYLAAANSFTASALDQPNIPAIQKTAVSVAVQEMYHLQQACNLMNVFNVTPVIPKLSVPAGERILVPHLDPGNRAFYVELGNLPAAIAAMIQIESPDLEGKPVVPNADVTYRSISDLYSATLMLLARYLAANELTPAALDPHFSPGRNQIAFGAFPSRFQFNVIEDRSDVYNTANAITDQGEGDTIAPFKSGGDGNVLPQYQGNASDRFYDDDKLTHLKRFDDISNAIGTLPPSTFYQANGQKSPDLPSWAAPYETLAAAINTIWSYLLDTMQQGFASGSLPNGNPTNPALPGFGDAMISFKYLVPMAWQYGYCPSFIYREGVSAQDVQDAMDAVDPWCLFHWDARTAAVRATGDLNACQGLNLCAGKGWGAIATKEGDGACATADTHTCVGSNSCTHQGGCGYFSDGLPASDQWVPGQNTALPNNVGTGGCQTPISTRQVFHNYPDSSFPSGWDSLKALRLTPVWTRARDLVAQKLGVDPSQLPTPQSQQIGTVNYDGDQRRQAVIPSSTS